MTFTYPGREVPALRNINLKIPAGETVALVGRSGSGKSTIASPTTRFYDIDNINILMDGHDLREYILASLRNQSGGAGFAKTHLFNDTVANNIAYARRKNTAASRLKRRRRPMLQTLPTRWIMARYHHRRKRRTASGVSASVSRLPGAYRATLQPDSDP